MAHLYSEARDCVCGYSTRNRSAFSKHSRSCHQSDNYQNKSKMRNDVIDEKNARIASLENQNNQLTEQIKSSQEQIKTMQEQMKTMHESYERQLVSKDEQIHARDKQLNDYSKKEGKKRSRSDQSKPPRDQVEAEKILMEQDYRCAGVPGFTCPHAGEQLPRGVQFDVDHKIPYKLTQDNSRRNKQGLCRGGCHAWKTRVIDPILTKYADDDTVLNDYKYLNILPPMEFSCQPCASDD